MGKLLKTVVLGMASGAAAAYFLSTEKGKKVVEAVKSGVADYKADPEFYHQAAKDKVAEYKDLATNTFDEYKEKWESGEFSAENLGQAVKETVNQVKEKVTATSDDIIEGEFVEPAGEVEPETVVADDIIIDLEDKEDQV